MASMTRSALRDQVRRLGRVGSNVADSILNTWLYEAVKKFQDDVLWLDQTRSYYVREMFTLAMTEGLQVRLTTDADLEYTYGRSTIQSTFANMSGAQLSSIWTSAWETEFDDTGIYTSWSTATLKMTIGISTEVFDSTGFYIGPPAYTTKDWQYDYSYKMFGITAETSSDEVTYTGSIPPFCTSEYPLPPDFLYVKEARFSDKRYPLLPTIYKSRNDSQTGTPSHYYIKGNFIGVTPQPTDAGRTLRLDYYYEPADFTAPIADGDADDALQPFPAVFDFALIWYAIYLYKNNQDDTQGELKASAKYEREVQKAKQRNQARVGGSIDLEYRGNRYYDPRRFNMRGSRYNSRY